MVGKEGGQEAFITREIVNIDRDYGDGIYELPTVRYDIVLPKMSNEQVLEFHDEIDKFIRNFRFNNEEEENDV